MAGVHLARGPQPRPVTPPLVREHKADRGEGQSHGLPPQLVNRGRRHAAHRGGFRRPSTRPRHGQHRNVLVRKFVTSGTIEEKIELMLTEKRQLTDELIDGDGEVGLTELPDDELLDLVRLDVTRAAP